MGKSGLLDGIGISSESEESVAIKALFPTKNEFKMLQMITELQPRVITPMSAVGTVRRWAKNIVSKTHRNFDTLGVFQEEYNLNQVARERKGRLELSEVVASTRRPREGEETN